MSRRVTNKAAANKLDRSRIGDRLAMLREALERTKITQKEICNSIGLNASSTWSDWEKGRLLPNVEWMSAFSTKYNVSLDFIYLGRLIGLREDLAYVLTEANPDLRLEDPDRLRYLALRNPDKTNPNQPT